jgi:hypothetical protein
MLPQFGNRSLSPVIEWESVMRIIHEASGWVTKSDEIPSTAAESVWSMHDLAAPRSRPSAMSRLMTFVVEGLAAYAEATHPYLIDPGDATTWRTNERDPQMTWKTQDHRSEAWVHSDRPSRRVGLRLQRNPISSRVARFFGKLRFGRRHKAPTVRVDRLDDRVLRDIGVDRHQFEFRPGHMGPDGW